MIFAEMHATLSGTCKLLAAMRATGHQNKFNHNLQATNRKPGTTLARVGYIKW